MTVVVSEIRRYPVKSMAGESLASAPVDSRGLVGDRWFAVVDEDARLASGKNSRRFRRRDAIFDYTSRTMGGGVRVSGPAGEWLVGDPDLDRALTTIMGDHVRVLAEDGTPHHDDREVSLIGTASLDWCREHLDVDADRRRIRPNLVVETAEPFIEETWSGGLTIGSVRLAVVQRIERCRMIDIAQEGLPLQGGWLKALGETRDANLGIYLEVAEPGTLHVGDEVLLTG